MVAQPDTDEFGGVLLDENPSPEKTSRSPQVGETDEFGGIAIDQARPATLLEGAGAESASISADFLGGPVDLVTAGLNAGIDLANKVNASLDTSVITGSTSKPFSIPNIDPSKVFGGSASFERGFNALGIETEIAPERVSPESEIGRKTANVLTQGGLLALAPFAAARKGFVSGPVQRSVTRNPGKFASVEAAGVSGSAQGAGLAEAFDPGDEVTAFTSELAGGLVNPAGFVARNVSRVPVGKALKAFTPSGREQRAADIVRKSVLGAGEDPEVVAKALEAAELSGVKLTSGVKSGSQGLIALERSVARTSPKFGAESQTIAQQGLENLRSAADNLTATGDPNALRVGAQARAKHIEAVLEGRLKAAEAKALTTAHKFARDPAAKGQASLEISQTLRAALKEARAAENDLWGRINKKQASPVSGLNAGLTRARSKLLDAEDLPLAKPVRDQLQAVLDDGGTDAGTLLKLRSRVLAEGKKLRASGDFLGASVADDLSSGIIDDLAALDDPAVDAAREFSRQLNDRFSRSFARNATSSDKFGAERISPETLLDRAFAGNDTAKSARFRELADAGRFGDEVSEADLLLGPSVVDAQGEFLRAAASTSLENGVVNPARLNTFLRSNQQVLQQFPEIAADLGDAKRAAEVLSNISKQTDRLRKSIASKGLFAKLINTDNVDLVVSNAIFDPRNSETNTAQLARIAKRSGLPAKEGLQTAVFDAILAKSRTQAGLDFQRALTLLDTPASRASQALSTTLREAGVTSKDQLASFRKLVTRAAQIQANLNRSVSPEEVDLATDALSDFIIRVGGARLGASVSQGPSTLIAASAGSRFLRGALEKVPASRVQELLVEAAKDPAFAAALLRKPKNRTQRRVLDRQLNAFLIQAGLIEDHSDD